MSKYIVQEDGSLLFETPILFVSANYAQNPDNPCHYIPKYDVCKFRRKELTILKCGKTNVDWSCSKFTKMVNVAICRSCEVPVCEK